MLMTVGECDRARIRCGYNPRAIYQDPRAPNPQQLLRKYNSCLCSSPVEEAVYMLDFLHSMTPDQAVLWDVMQEIIAARG